MARNRQDAAPDGATKGAEAAPGDEPLRAAKVADYLRRNPDFLAEHPGLLDVLTPPQRVSGDGVVDLQSVMIERQRSVLRDLEGAHADLITTGRTNLAAQSRVHEAVLAMLVARSFEHLIEIVTSDLAFMLDLDAVTLAVEQSEQGLPPVRLGGVLQLEADTVDALLGPGRGARLRQDIEGDPAIFGAGAGLVASEALIRLDISPATPPAMLALGSRQPEHFHPGQGTELLGFLAGALERCIRTWLDLPE